MIAVCNSTPLIALAKINRLDLLRDCAYSLRLKERMDKGYRPGFEASITF
jgi:hypothetical protein